MYRRISVLLPFLLLPIIGGLPAISDTLPPLKAQERMSLPAVGLVRTKGPETTVICSGTLVAQDLVVTSAHCTMKYIGRMNTVQFVAGRNGARFLANSGAAEIIRHPVWDDASGLGRHRYDIAVLRLARPIAPERVSPIRLLPAGEPLPERGTLVGYQNTDLKLLHGRSDCALVPTSKDGLLSSDCPATGGNSGGAVLARHDAGWRLAGVIVARGAQDQSALLAEVDYWLRDHVRAALDREARRSARID